MTIGLQLLCVLLALVAFALAFFNVPKYNWVAGGYFFTLLAFTLAAGK
jgi:hypothetical protein